MTELGKMLKKEKQHGMLVIPETTSLVGGKSCPECCFHTLNSCSGIRCVASERKDGYTVIFHEVE